MSLYSNDLYLDDVHAVASMDLPWEKLQGKKVMLTGGTGLLGSFFVDVILEKNVADGLDCTVYVLGRSAKKAQSRFIKFEKDSHFVFMQYDVNLPLVFEGIERVDYILHLASNTHPLQYSLDPIGTITTNIIGLQNMLDFAATHDVTRFVFASSNEIYGENRGDVELFDEDYCGYINSNTMRAGYPESKRCGEALCQAYRAQKGLDIVIPRFTRSFGPTMQMSDTKAISQFIKKGIAKEDIVLKSEGSQYYSYQYVSDSISGLLTILFYGVNGDAYNIAEEHSDIRLRDLAAMIADFSGSKVTFEVPDTIESAGYSTATKARLNGNKLQSLGWRPMYDIKSGIERTIRILSAIQSVVAV